MPSYRNYPKSKKEENLYVPIKVYLPRGIYNILKARAKEMMLPISRLVGYAVDNELDVPAPFNFPCDWPRQVYLENAYSNEAPRLLDLFAKFGGRASRDSLMLCRREAGIEDRQTFMLVLRQLFEEGFLGEKPPPKKAKFEYPPGFKYIYLVDQMGKIIDDEEDVDETLLTKKHKLERKLMELNKQLEKGKHGSSRTDSPGIGKANRGNDEGA